MGEDRPACASKFELGLLSLKSNMTVSRSSVYVLNGPNLNLLGTREPDMYGSASLADLEALCRVRAESLDLRLVFRQTNLEGELVDWIQEASNSAIGVVLNPAAYTHTSIAILDAIRACSCPVVEVHLSNPSAREPYRRVSRVAGAVIGTISGLGSDGYLYALDALARRRTSE